jgi:hypothetical protein
MDRLRSLLSKPWTPPLLLAVVGGGSIGVLAGRMHWSTAAIYGTTFVLVPVVLALRIATDRRASRHSHTPH